MIKLAVGMNFARRASRIRKIDRVRNETLQNLCGVVKGMDVRGTEWYCRVVRMDEAVAVAGGITE